MSTDVWTCPHGYQLDTCCDCDEEHAKEVASLQAQLTQARKWIETWGHNSECLVVEGHPDYACDCEVRHILPALAHPSSPEGEKP